MLRALATAGKVALGSFLVLLAFAAVAIVGASLGKRFGPGASQTAAKPPAAEAGPVEEADSAAVPSEETATEGAASEETSVEERSAQEGASQEPARTPAEVLARRFVPDDDDTTTTQAPTFALSMLIPAVPGETFDPAAVSGMAPAEPVWPNVEKPPGAAIEGGEDARGPAGRTLRRSSARYPAVVNDAMIASIKRRLRLTAEQEKLWVPVEAALRKLTYTRAAMNPSRGQSGPIPYIDPASHELQELKAAALPLIARLNDGQKREVKDIVHVMGLEAVASQF